MEKKAFLSKIFWSIQRPWHLRQHERLAGVSVKETVRGLQALFLIEQGKFLLQTLAYTFARPVALSELQRLEIVLYQEGVDQRVWRAQATLEDQTKRTFGIIVARGPGASSTLTQKDFQHLTILYEQQARFCVKPYIQGVAPIADGVVLYTVEWLEHYKELVFEVTRDGGVFFVNAHGAQKYFTLQESRVIWRHLLTILCWYPDLRAVNIQAGDFVGHLLPNGDIALKLTTARELVADSTPEAAMHTLLATGITLSGYLSDGKHPFDRTMPEAAFRHRMQAVLQRRFGPQAAAISGHQWHLFCGGAFARQEDWLKEDCILAMYDRFCEELPARMAWQVTCQRWLAYAAAVHSGRFPSSWWFPQAHIPIVLKHLESRVFA